MSYSEKQATSEELTEDYLEVSKAYPVYFSNVYCTATSLAYYITLVHTI
ncbi:hypothetical protein [Candidatus Bathycorpusculum sp.]|nr:hypothetical protein [Candidatus Termitimicrobium sp.]MCL2686017.1 hypothetical protein [Candidatus Termitimicrobium sp.]